VQHAPIHLPWHQKQMRGLDGRNSDNDDVEEVPHSADCDKQVKKGSAAHKSPIKNQRRILETCSSSILLILLWKKQVQASLL
jgi:hypothetical protein